MGTRLEFTVTSLTYIELTQPTQTALPVYVIVGATVGGVTLAILLIIVVVVIAFVLLKRRNKQPKK